jgi:hypothetical protein
MRLVRNKSDISKNKLLLLSVFISLLLLPYVYFGYLAFFPDVFSVLAAYWIAQSDKKNFNIILISYLVAVLRVILGGSPLAASTYIIVGLVLSFTPHIFSGDFIGVVSLTFILTLLSSLTISFDVIVDKPETLLLVLIKLISSTLFSILIFPFVIKEEREKITLLK